MLAVYGSVLIPSLTPIIVESCCYRTFSVWVMIFVSYKSDFARI